MVQIPTTCSKVVVSLPYPHQCHMYSCGREWVPEGVDAVNDTGHVLLIIHVRYSGVEDFRKLDRLHCIDVLDDVVRVSERQPLCLQPQ